MAARLDYGYELASRLLGCEPGEVAFGTGHGQLYGDLIAAIPLKAGDRVLVSSQEWVGNLIALKRRADSAGATIEVAPCDATTAVDVEALKRILDDRVRLVALTWIGASGPLVNPATELGAALAGTNAVYVIDASQALGQLPIDVTELQCDALIACGRKYLRGPRGTAIAYLATRLASDLQPVRLDDHAGSWAHGHVTVRKSARVLETAEFSVALRLGLIRAIEQALSGDLIRTRASLDRTASCLRDRLAALPGVRVHDVGRLKAAAVTFSIDGLSCDQAQSELASRGLMVGYNGPAYTPIDLVRRGIPELLRASVHLETDDDTITKLVQAVAELAGNDHNPPMARNLWI
ncbi:hypothetical protein ASD03_32375 [Ensifer sp. Root127]|nr:hypothetical protein ASD03_32375 [Ensifer sp. Root127]